MARIVSSSVAILGLAVLLFTVHPLLVLGLLVTMLPLAWSNMTGGRDYYRNAVRRTPRRRIISYLQYLLTMLDSAKETRAFGLAPYLLARHGELYDEELDEFRRVVSQRQRREVLATLVGSIVNAARRRVHPLAALLAAHLAPRGDRRLRRAAAAAAADRQPRRGDRAHARERAVRRGSVVVSRRRAAAARAGLDRAGAVGVRDAARRGPLLQLSRTGPSRCSTGCRWRSGWARRWRWSARTAPARRRSRSCCAACTTPDGGTISWDGVDIGTCDPDDLRTKIAVIFQDFVRYELAAKDNIGFGDLGVARRPRRDRRGRPPRRRRRVHRRPARGLRHAPGPPLPQGPRPVDRPVAAPRARARVLPRRAARDHGRADRVAGCARRERAVRDDGPPVPRPRGAADLAPLLERAQGRSHLRPARRTDRRERPRTRT